LPLLVGATVVDSPDESLLDTLLASLSAADGEVDRRPSRRLRFELITANTAASSILANSSTAVAKSSFLGLSASLM
jgi:hypothetical protein